MLAQTWNYEFYSPNGSYFISDIQDYFGFIIKNKNFNWNPPVQI